MSARGVVSLSGNPRRGSRTSHVAALLGADLHDELGLPGEAVHLDLAELPNPLAAGASEALAEAVEAVRGAAVLVVATPTYKASYTGLLKAFVDLLPPAALDGVLAVPVITLGSPAHTLAAEVHLRPLLLELGATTPTASVALLDADLADAAATSRRVVGSLVPYLTAVAALAARDSPVLRVTAAGAGLAP
ncbi:FMN reductase [Motilibacter peucedani]|uniref:FMN reductase n=1 Tax=Motilibacter peucedani TaxID=598650 RepID=A0A420XV80_9ACTN|nr:NAD(P)H-dependent oxidoreductase [Motilibacter peucedani]RKS84195.1 FMN reductase [Motilibacter peucedani]